MQLPNMLRNIRQKSKKRLKIKDGGKVRSGTHDAHSDFLARGYIMVPSKQKWKG